MNLGRFVLEMDDLDEVEFLGRFCAVVFGNSLGVQLNVVIYAEDSLIFG